MNLYALKFALLFLLCANFAIAEETALSGEFSYTDPVNKSVINKKISIVFTDISENATLTIDGEGELPAIFEESKVSAYSKRPLKFHYYSLDLEPRVQYLLSLTEKNPIIKSESGSDIVPCPKESTALLSAFKGDGSKETFCITLK